jgi:hypothetical protein
MTVLSEEQYAEERARECPRRICEKHPGRSWPCSTPRIPPGNRLEELHQDRKGQHSFAINDPFRVCFVGRDGDAYDVEITDYH